MVKENIIDWTYEQQGGFEEIILLENTSIKIQKVQIKFLELIISKDCRKSKHRHARAHVHTIWSEDGLKGTPSIPLNDFVRNDSKVETRDDIRNKRSLDTDKKEVVEKHNHTFWRQCVNGD